MAKKPDLSLHNVKKSPKLGDQVFRASDLLTKEEKAELRRVNAKGRKKKRQFTTVDAYIAEIMARFGYSAYLAWNEGDIPDKKMACMIAAERSREKAQLLELEGIIIAMVGACVQRQKGKPAPKGPKTAIKIFKQAAKAARGE